MNGWNATIVIFVGVVVALFLLMLAGGVLELIRQ